MCCVLHYKFSLSVATHGHNPSKLYVSYLPRWQRPAKIIYEYDKVNRNISLAELYYYKKPTRTTVFTILPRTWLPVCPVWSYGGHN
jgi:hypothetical protein